MSEYEGSEGTPDWGAVGEAVGDAAAGAYEWVEDAVDTVGEWLDEAAQAAAAAEAEKYDPLRGLDGELLEGI